MQQTVKLTECPRDAMQGLHNFIPTEIKAAYINRLLQVGFDTIDFGSFVSANAVPQMQDTAGVLAQLNFTGTLSKLLAIVANYRGAQDAVSHAEITYLGYPFSISDTFQQRNTNSGIEQAFETVKQIQKLCTEKGKKLRIYLSMGFGNPYGDEWSIELLHHWAEEMIALGIEDIYLADTIGIATPKQITTVMQGLKDLDAARFGMHLHSTPDTWEEKIEAAYSDGCRMFDTALRGFGGCPMAADELTGNIATENVVAFLEGCGEETGLGLDKLRQALEYTSNVFDR